MDNLTHSLVGALIGQMGLKRKTGLAMPTLIIAANLPDIDAVATLLGGHQHLAIRRGITHGPVAMVVLPLLLWAAMLWFDQWQARRGTRAEKRLPVDAKWLLALAYIGCLSHPLLDWFNSYGIRLLEPLSSQWFYGDTLFIIDIWILLMLGLSLALSMRSERRGISSWQRPALIGFVAICAYIFVNGLFTGLAKSHVRHMLGDRDEAAALVVASPPPITFWKRDIFWRTSTAYGTLHVDMTRDDFTVLDVRGRPTGMDDPRLLLWAKANADARAFLFWARMPIAEVQGDTILLRDQRFMHPLVQERFEVRLIQPDAVSNRK